MATSRLPEVFTAALEPPAPLRTTPARDGGAPFDEHLQRAQKPPVEASTTSGSSNSDPSQRESAPPVEDSAEPAADTPTAAVAEAQPREPDSSAEQPQAEASQEPQQTSAQQPPVNGTVNTGSTSEQSNQPSANLEQQEAAQEAAEQKKSLLRENAVKRLAAKAAGRRLTGAAHDAAAATSEKAKPRTAVREKPNGEAAAKSAADATQADKPQLAVTDDAVAVKESTHDSAAQVVTGNKEAVVTAIADEAGNSDTGSTGKDEQAIDVQAKSGAKGAPVKAAKVDAKTHIETGSAQDSAIEGGQQSSKPASQGAEQNGADGTDDSRDVRPREGRTARAPSAASVPNEGNMSDAVGAAEDRQAAAAAIGSETAKSAARTSSADRGQGANPAAGSPLPASDSSHPAGREAIAPAQNAATPTVAAPAAAGRSTAARTGGDNISEVERVRFVQRVSRAMQTATDKGGPLRLRLSPPELGSLRLEVSVRDGAVSARLEAETPQARSILLENLPALRERLAEQNLKIERLDVELMGQSQTDGQQQAAHEERQEATAQAKVWRAQREQSAGDVPETAAAPTARVFEGTSGLNVVV